MSLWVRNEEILHMQCSTVISKDARAVGSDGTTQEPRRALRITRLLFEILRLCLRRTRLERKSTKNRSKIDENPSQIDPKSMKNRSWAVLGAQSRFGDAFGRARDGCWTPKCRLKADPGAPQAHQERPGAVQKRSQGAQETLQELLGPLPRRPYAPFGWPSAVGSVCGSIFKRFWSKRGSSEVRFVSLLPVFYRCRTVCALNVCRTQKPRKNCRFWLQNRGLGRPGDPRASKFESQTGQVERKSASDAPAGAANFFCQRERGHFERESASQSLRGASGPPRPRAVISESSNGYFFDTCWTKYH